MTRVCGMAPEELRLAELLTTRTKGAIRDLSWKLLLLLHGGRLRRPLGLLLLLVWRRRRLSRLWRRLQRVAG